MSPRGGWFPYDRPARKAVEGGVKVARPGKVTNPVAAGLVECLVSKTSTAIAGRGRTYARAGQVVEVRIGDGEATATIQGSNREPYAVRLGAGDRGRARADCTCPYGCSGFGWCKHAAALAYVVADLVDRDPAIERAWTGQGTDAINAINDAAGKGGVAGEVTGLRAALNAAPRPVDAAAQWRAAVEVLPPPR